MQFINKTVLVTGANRGIGRALVESLLAEGVKKIYACSRDVSKLNAINLPKVKPLSLDITSQEQIRAAAEAASDTQILINNAGVAAYENLVDGDLDLIRRDMETNYFGTLNMARAFVPILQQNAPAAIVNIASIAAFVNFPFLGGYCATKAALFSISQGLRIQLADSGISVHTVNPGPIDTDMTASIEMEKTSPKDTADAILSALRDDVSDIFPDPTSQSMFDLWRNNYRDLEQSVLEMATS
ncbi:SDR family oxidoreductase [Poriferisphaera sp. WC338]|uniref:SDR family oxidoreductase n=1 Tax=Poriferisphaera sp. WC338 TaxID=3425129 RepID=UPI003D819558